MKPAAIDKSDETTRFPMEHRWGHRVDCHVCVGISAGADTFGAGRLRDVSMSGAFIETGVALRPGLRINLAVAHPGAAQSEIVVSASVVRAECDGVGVEWCETPAESICALLGCTAHCAELDV
jgi:hypothetical protein